MSYKACKQGTEAVFSCVACSCLCAASAQIAPQNVSLCMYLGRWSLAGHSFQVVEAEVPGA